MRSQRWRTAVILVTALATTLIGASCAGSTRPEGSWTTTGPASGTLEEELRAVLDRTIAVDSVTATATLGARAGGDEQEATTRPAVDFVSGNARATMEVGPTTVDIVSDGDRAWLRTDDPRLSAALPAGATWIETPADELVERGVISSSRDVNWATLYALAAARDVEVVGGHQPVVVDGHRAGGLEPRRVDAP